MKYQVIHFNPKQNYGKVSSLEDYYYKESSVLEFTHSNVSYNGQQCHWLKSLGLSDWCIETDMDKNALIEVLTKEGHTVK